MSNLEPVEGVRELALRLAAIKAIKDVLVPTEEATKAAIALQMDAGDRKHATTGDGHSVATVSLTAPQPSLKVIDEAAFLAWVKENRPTAVVETVRTSDSKSILDEAKRTGELPDGVQLIEREPYVTVRQSADQRLRLMAYPSGEILDAAMSFDVPALQGGPDEH